MASRSDVEWSRLVDGADLCGIEQLIWRELVTAVSTANHPWRFAVLGTRGNGVALRTVVLRKVFPDERGLVCHTDLRSRKVTQLRRDARAAWLVYDPGSRVQVRAQGRVTLHTDDPLADSVWSEALPEAKRMYLSPRAPGTEITAPSDAAVPDGDLEAGRKNFCVLRLAVEQIDWLWLGPAHVRAVFDYPADRFVWVAP